MWYQVDITEEDDGLLDADLRATIALENHNRQSCDNWTLIITGGPGGDYF